jgi:hypothetical protein
MRRASLAVIPLKTFLNKTLGGFADLKPDPLIVLYKSGEKIEAIEAATGSDRNTLYRRLRHAGEPLRTALHNRNRHPLASSSETVLA